MNTFYGTFGDGQPYRKHYVLIIAPDRETARQMMFEAHGNKFCCVYDERESAQKVEPYNYDLLGILDYSNERIEWEVKL